MISPENVLSHKHLIRIIKKTFFLAFCDQLVLADISFLALNLFSWLFCQLKEEESPVGEFFWKYVSITVLLATARCFHLDCSHALTGSRL